MIIFSFIIFILKNSDGFSSDENNSIEPGNAIPENLIPDQNPDYLRIAANGQVRPKQPNVDSYSAYPVPKPANPVSNPVKPDQRPLGPLIQKTFFAEDVSDEEAEGGEAEHELEHEEHDGGILSGNTPVSWFRECYPQPWRSLVTGD